MSQINFEIIGHIMILKESNNEEKLLEFGKNQLEKRTNIRTIAIQKSKVEGRERTREIKYLLGDKDFETIHREYGNEFLLNPCLTFFSPRLSYERNRIANLVEDNEIIINFFSGVGPFSIAIARKCTNCFIHSIEINKSAYEYLLLNIEKNKCKDRIKPYLGDAFQIVPAQLLNKANRILLPLPLEAEKSLILAINALNNRKGTIHWQITDKLISSKLNQELIQEKIESISDSARMTFSFDITESRIIRWLSPGIAHIAVDIKIL